MKKIIILGIALIIIVTPALSANASQKSKSVGKALIAAGCTIFTCSMILTLGDQKTGCGHFQGYEVTYKDFKTQYLIGDAVGVVLFSIGAVLYSDDTKKLQVSAKVKEEKEAVVQLTFSF